MGKNVEELALREHAVNVSAMVVHKKLFSICYKLLPFPFLIRCIEEFLASGSDYSFG